MAQTLGSLQKALDVIDEMARDGGNIGISELSRRVGLAKNQVFRILKTLEEYEYVRQNVDRSYSLGLRFFEIGQQVIKRNSLILIAAPVMDELRNITEETVNLLVRDRFHAVCVARRESPARIRMSTEIGGRYLLHAGACPKALLAFQPDGLVDAVLRRYGLPAYTEHTITNPESFEEHLARIRAQGYAESDEDIDVHAYSIAVPIYGAEETIVAAMSVAGPVFRLTPETRPEILRLLAVACDHISTQLGARRLPSTQIAWPATHSDLESEEVSLTPAE